MSPGAALLPLLPNVVPSSMPHSSRHPWLVPSPLTIRRTALISCHRALPCSYKFDPKRQWATFEVPIPELDCCSPKKLIDYLRPRREGVPEFPRWALRHHAFTFSVEDPKDGHSNPKKLSGDVCFTSNRMDWGPRLQVPTELFLMVDCQQCTEPRFAMLQSPEPASIEFDSV